MKAGARDEGRGTREKQANASATPEVLSLDPSPLAPRPSSLLRQLGQRSYESVLNDMRTFTLGRSTDTADEIWSVEHPPVYTLGVAAKPEHLPRIDNGIPVVRSDRGGQITYHGPGQVVVYTLFDLGRRKVGVRALVRKLEQAVIELLAGYRVDAHGREDAPGVYVGAAKIAALGLRIRNGCCYHGVSLNVDMDLAPFAVINPCGHAGLEVTQLRDFGIVESPDAVAAKLTARLASI